MDFQISVEIANGIKQEIGEEDAAINDCKIGNNEKQEHSVERKTDIASLDCGDTFSNHNVIEYDLSQTKQEKDDISAKEEFVVIEYEQEDAFCNIKDEIDIDDAEYAESYFKCVICDFESVLHSSYQAHMKNCHQSLESLSLPVGLAQSRHNLEVDIEEEVIEYAPQKEKKFECAVCHKRFITKRYLIVHANSTHKNITHECEICHKTFPHKGNLFRHVKVVHDNKRFECKICNKIVSSKNQLIAHIEGIHDNIKHVCEICCKVFSYKKSLHKHVNVIHKKIRFNCEVCDKTFVNKDNVKKHMKAIHEESCYECEICKKTFNRKPNLDRHMKTVHFEKNCEICNEIFTHNRVFNEHMKVVHGEIK